MLPTHNSSPSVFHQTTLSPTANLIIPARLTTPLASVTCNPLATRQLPVVNAVPSIDAPMFVSQHRTIQEPLLQSTTPTMTERITAGLDVKEPLTNGAETDPVSFSGSPSTLASSFQYEEVTALSSSLADLNDQIVSLEEHSQSRQYLPLGNISSSSISGKATYELDSLSITAEGAKPLDFKCVESNVSQDTSTPFSFGSNIATKASSSSNGLLQVDSDSRASPSLSHKAMANSISEVEDSSSVPAILNQKRSTSLEELTTPFYFGGSPLVKSEIATNELELPKANLEEVTLVSIPTVEIENKDMEIIIEDEDNEEDFSVAAFISAAADEIQPSLQKTNEDISQASAGSSMQSPSTTSAADSSSTAVRNIWNVIIPPIATDGSSFLLGTSAMVTSAVPSTAAAALGAAFLAAANAPTTETRQSSMTQVITISPQSSTVGGSCSGRNFIVQLSQPPVTASNTVSSVTSTTSQTNDVLAPPTAPAFVFGAVSSTHTTSAGNCGQMVPSATTTYRTFGQQEPSLFGQAVPSLSGFRISQLSELRRRMQATGFGAMQIPAKGFGFGGQTGAPMPLFSSRGLFETQTAPGLSSGGQGPSLLGVDCRPNTENNNASAFGFTLDPTQSLTSVSFSSSKPSFGNFPQMSSFGSLTSQQAMPRFGGFVSGNMSRLGGLTAQTPLLGLGLGDFSSGSGQLFSPAFAGTSSSLGETENPTNSNLPFQWQS